MIGDLGVGLDDLRYSPALQSVLVPAGRTGSLDLIDPATGAVEAIRGFAEFAIDRTRLSVDVIDPGERTIVASAPLAGGPDYVRFVPYASACDTL
jgi:hypothetical protein